jgi:hypothetical protein
LLGQEPRRQLLAQILFASDIFSGQFNEHGVAQGRHAKSGEAGQKQEQGHEHEPYPAERDKFVEINAEKTDEQERPRQAGNKVQFG